MYNDSFSLAPDDPFWPQAFEPLRCPDEHFARAYESFTPAFRAHIKTAIALLFSHFGETRRIERRECESPSSGFAETGVVKAAPWALCVFDAIFGAPARLIEPCVLPALCGVANIGAICLDGLPLPQTALALELCGVEDVFCLERKHLEKFIRDLPAEGRITLFGSRAAFPELAFFSSGLIHAEDREPLLFVPAPELFDLEAISLAQGQSREELLASGTGRLDGLFAPGPDCGNARLVLGPGLEAFWLLEDYGPRFFKTAHYAFKFMPAAR